MIEKFRLRSQRAGSKTGCTLLTLLGVGSDDEDDAEQEIITDVEQSHPVGFVARPSITASTEVMGYREGDHVIALHTVDKSIVVVCDDGGAVMYCPAHPGSRVTLDKTGKISIVTDTNLDIDITSTGTGKITLNGGNANANRVGDGVAPNATLVTFFGDIVAAFNSLTPPTVLAPFVNSTIGTTIDGNPRVKV